MTYTFKIYEGYDHYNGYPLYHCYGADNDYIGEWHTTKEDAQKEKEGLEEYHRRKDTLGPR